MAGELADDAVVDLYPLHIGAEEDGACEVGRADTGVFVALPMEGVDLVTWLADGRPVREVRERFTARYGLAPELEDFLDGIAECGFVRRIARAGSLDSDGDGTEAEGTPADPRRIADGTPQVDPGPGPAPRGILLLAAIPPNRVKWLLSWPMKLAYAGMWATVPALLIADPRLAPRPSDALLTSDVLLNALVIAVIAWTLVLAHEAAHAVAARAVGCAGRLSISRRLWFLVGQTELADIRTVPRRRRYAPYLAGMTWDVAVILACLLVELAGADPGNGGGARLLRAVVYTLSLSMIFQFSVFMRTDVYYVIANWLRLGDLMGDTRRFVGNVFARLARKPARHDLSQVPARELKIIRWYAVYYVVGSAAATAGFFLLSIPAVVRMARIAVSGISAGVSTGRCWQGAGFLALVAFQFGTLALVSYLDRSSSLRRSGEMARGGSTT